MRRKSEVDDLVALGICQSVTSVMFSSEINGPVAHGSTQLMPDMAHGGLCLSNSDISSMSFVHF